MSTPRVPPQAKTTTIRRIPRLSSLHKCSKHSKSTEDMELEYIKKFAFRANPINKEILKADYFTDVPIVRGSTNTTIAKPFTFRTEERCSRRRTLKTVSGEPKRKRSASVWTPSRTRQNLMTVDSRTPSE